MIDKALAHGQYINVVYEISKQAQSQHLNELTVIVDTDQIHKKMNMGDRLTLARDLVAIAETIGSMPKCGHSYGIGKACSNFAEFQVQRHYLDKTGDEFSCAGHMVEKIRLNGNGRVVTMFESR